MIKRCKLTIQLKITMNTTLKSLKGIMLILFISVFFVLPAHSQVTIGTLETPLKGALLDLRQQPETAGALNSTDGLKFPRVSLTGLTSLQPLLSPAEDGAATAAAKLQYKGMTVYNVTVDAAANLQDGLYVWDGVKWNVFQTGTVNNMNGTFIFTLFNTTANSNISITTGGADGLGGSLLTWRIGGRDSSYVELPEDGAYMFSFRLYGTTGTQNRTNSFYFSSLKNSPTSNVFDVQEIVLTSSVTASYLPMTYTANLTVAGKKGDKIYFRLAELNASAHIITWTLNGGTNEYAANRTSMVYWKL